MKIIFRQATVFDGWDDQLAENRDVLVEDGIITAIGETGMPTDGAEVVECAGRVLMPGLIDGACLEMRLHDGS